MRSRVRVLVVVIGRTVADNNGLDYTGKYRGCQMSLTLY